MLITSHDVFTHFNVQRHVIMHFKYLNQHNLQDCLFLFIQEPRRTCPQQKQIN